MLSYLHTFDEDNSNVDVSSLVSCCQSWQSISWSSYDGLQAFMFQARPL